MPSGAFRYRNGSQERTQWGDGIIRSDFDGYMNGADVFSFTISQVRKLLNSFMKDQEITADDYEAVILCQANLYILKQVAKKI